MAISAKYNDGNSTHLGHVRIYQNNTGTWTQVGEDIDGEAESDLSGQSVCLNSNGSIVAISAVSNDGNGAGAGHVRIFQNNTGTWTQIGEDIDGEAAGDGFGISVSLSSDGSIAAIGAWFNAGNGAGAGHVRIYQNNSGTWTQIGEDIDGEAAEDTFGRSVSLNSDGSIVAIGAHGNDGNGENSGHVRVYRLILLNVYSLSLSGISIYPNPTKGIVEFDFAENKIQQIKIFDITGKVVFSRAEIQQNETVDLSNFDYGIYIINIHTDKEVFTTKIVKE